MFIQTYSMGKNVYIIGNICILWGKCVYYEEHLYIMGKNLYIMGKKRIYFMEKFIYYGGKKHNYTGKLTRIYRNFFPNTCGKF